MSQDDRLRCVCKIVTRVMFVILACDVYVWCCVCDLVSRVMLVVL